MTPPTAVEAFNRRNPDKFTIPIIPPHSPRQAVAFLRGRQAGVLTATRRSTARSMPRARSSMSGAVS